MTSRHNLLGFFRITTFLLILNVSLEAELRDYYIGAVVEYQPSGTPWDSTPEELLQKNCNNYVELIRDASAHGADIVVFPEYGMTTLGVPRGRDEALPYLQYVPEIGINSCLQDVGKYADYQHRIIRDLSCAARHYRIYLVVNVGEVQNCTTNRRSDSQPCHADGRRQFNSNVAFNRDGEIVAKYRKQYLYFEDQFESPAVADISIFKTDFGVEFGMFICFDMMFEKPAVQLVELGVKNIVYPTAWVDELPFLMAIQSQNIWAAAAGVNLLASGYHQPLGGQLGSGIFSGKSGALNYTFDPDSGTRLIIAEVPISPSPEKLHFETHALISRPTDILPNAYHSFLRENITNYATVKLDFSYNTANACHNGTCCSAKYLLTLETQAAPLTYRLITFGGTRKVAMETAEFSWQVCGIMRCLNDTLASCTENDRSESSMGFSNFEYLRLIGGPFKTEQAMSPALNAMDIYFQEIPFSLFEFSTTEQTSELVSNSLATVPIQTIAIINRMYF